MKLSLKHKARKLLRKTVIVLISAILLFFLIDVITPVDTNVGYSTSVIARDGTVLHAWLAPGQQWRMKANLDDISPELRRAIIYKEDKHFFHHFGINPVAIGRAFINNLFHLRRTSGASTITMQVARMLDPKPR